MRVVRGYTMGVPATLENSFDLGALALECLTERVSQFRSLRAYATEFDLPYTTLQAFKRTGATTTTTITSICESDSAYKLLLRDKMAGDSDTSGPWHRLAVRMRAHYDLEQARDILDALETAADSAAHSSVADSILLAARIAGTTAAETEGARASAAKKRA